MVLDDRSRAQSQALLKHRRKAGLRAMTQLGKALYGRTFILGTSKSSIEQNITDVNSGTPALKVVLGARRVY